MADLPALIVLFKDIHEAVNRPDSTLGPSEWGTEADALAEIDEILRLLRSGTMPNERRLRVLFVAAGLLDEMERYSECPGETVGFATRLIKPWPPGTNRGAYPLSTLCSLSTAIYEVRVAPRNQALFLPLLVLAACTAQPSGAGFDGNCREATEPERLRQCVAQRAQSNDRDVLLACLPFSQPEHLRGLWAIALEDSSFSEGATSFRRDMSGSMGTWLEPDRWSSEQTRSGEGERVKAYLVEFVGRRSLCRSGYGHMGVYANEVLVDGFTLLREVE
jgi:hypothetical protein